MIKQIAAGLKRRKGSLWGDQESFHSRLELSFELYNPCLNRIQVSFIFVFYCYETNRCKLSSKHSFISSQFCRPEVWVGPTGLFASSLTRSKTKCQSDWALFWRRLEESASSFLQVVGRIQCLVAEVPIALLVAIVGPLSTSRHHPHSFSHGLLHLQSQQ